MTKFWDGIGGKLAERWAAVSVPALVFWLGGLLAWSMSRGGLSALKQPAGWLGKQPGATQAVVLLAALLGVAGSGVVVNRMTRPVLALLEGYWPSALRGLRRRLTERVKAQADKLEDEFKAMANARRDGTATPDQRERYAGIDRARRRIPDGDRVLPTRVGNVLRACETRPNDKYGLDAVVVWPHLWLLLPETSRDELTSARRMLDASVAACVWGVLFIAFTPWTLWALPLGIGVAAVSVRVWVPAHAEVFADLVEASFDLYRNALYTQLRWPLPANPHEERPIGRRVTTYLMRGLDTADPTFTPAD